MIHNRARERPVFSNLNKDLMAEVLTEPLLFDILTVLVQLVRFIHKEGCYGTS